MPEQKFMPIRKNNTVMEESTRKGNTTVMTVTLDLETDNTEVAIDAAEITVFPQTEPTRPADKK